MGDNQLQGRKHQIELAKKQRQYLPLFHIFCFATPPSTEVQVGLRCSSYGATSSLQRNHRSKSTSLSFVDCKIKRGTFAHYSFRPYTARMPMDNSLHSGQSDSNAKKFLFAVQALKGGK